MSEAAQVRTATGMNLEKLILGLFFFSGFPALTYQLVWQRALFGIFGVNIESVTIVVTAFMLGLGLGSMAGGWLSQKRGIALLPLLAAIELSTALFGLGSLHLFTLVGNLTLAWSLPATACVTLMLVLVPTLLMGATLPILVGYLTARSGSVGSSVGRLYYVNTLGAGVACVVAGLLLFPFLGMQGSVWVAAAINASVATGALCAYFASRGQALALPAVPTRTRRALVLAFAPTLGLACLGGFVSLSYELFFFRVVSFLSGGSATFFALTLGVFLIGLASGARAAGDYCRAGRASQALWRIVLTLGGANLVGFLFLPLVANAATLNVGLMIALALLLVYVQARMWGIILPFLAEMGIAPDHKAGLRTGQIYLANIIGSASGGILTGFVAMDHLTLVGMCTALLAIGLVCALLLCWALPLERRARWGLSAGVLALLCAALPLSNLLNQHVLEKLQRKTTWSAPQNQAFTHSLENRSGIITVDQHRVVFGNGAYDGHYNVSLVHDDNGIVRAYALSLYHPAPHQVLMIGLSSGSWAQVIANNPQVTHLTVVEINPGYQQMISQQPSVASLLHNPKVTLITDDGRRWLRRHPAARFDAIVMNTTFYFRANVSNLLSLEFLGLARQHLSPGGTLFYNSTSSNRVARTACLAFPYGMRVSNHMLVSPAPIHLDYARWESVLLSTRIDGQAVLDERRTQDRQTLNDLMGLENSNSSRVYGKQFFESCPAILKRTAGLMPVTDDNMGSEWRYIYGEE